MTSPLPQEVRVEVAPVFAPLLKPARYKGAHGGRGSGKSHFFSEHLIVRAAFKPVRAVCIREFQTSIRHSVKPLLESKIEKFGLQGLFEVKQHEIRGRYSGSLIIFQGMQSHNADSIKSLESFDIAWFEEAQRASDASIRVLRPTIRKPGSELWFSWNRTNTDDPVERLFYPDGPTGKPNPSAIVVEANWYDNPWFPEVLLEELEYDKRRDPDRYAHVWCGKFVSHSEARVFRNWRVEEFESSQLIEEGAPLFGPYLGADWGFSQDPTTLVCLWVYEEARRVYVEHEAWGLGVKLMDLPALFDAVPGARSHTIVADSARPETIDLLRDAGFDIRPSRKGRGSVEGGIEYLKSFDIVVHPRCRHTIDELTYYSWKVDPRSGRILNQVEDANNHIIDAMRYALEDRRSVHDFV